MTGIIIPYYIFSFSFLSSLSRLHSDSILLGLLFFSISPRIPNRLNRFLQQALALPSLAHFVLSAIEGIPLAHRLGARTRVFVTLL